MKIHFTITTCNRPKMLRALLDYIETTIPEDLEHTITVYNDGAEPQIPTGYVNAYETMTGQMGKRGYFRVWNRIIEELPTADFYLFLPDDVLPTNRDWIYQAIDQVGEIEMSNPGGAACLNILTDRGRTGIKSWGSGFAEIHDRHTLKTGWWDLCGVMNMAAVDVLRGLTMRIPASRWKNNSNLGSGVGMEVSNYLRGAGVDMFQTRARILNHLGHESQMNPGERRDTPMDTWEVEPICAGMATIPGREAQCIRAAKSILPYVDKLFITYNDPAMDRVTANAIGEVLSIEFPHRIEILYSDNSRGDAVKFAGIERIEWPFYYFTIDDDIIYPPGYTWTLIHKIEQYNRRPAVGVHAKTLPAEVSSFYRGHKVMYHTTTRVSKDQVVNCLGTGCLAFHSSTIEVGMEDFIEPNMADIYFAIAAQKQNVPLISIARPANWLKIQEVKNTIYEQEHKNDWKQTTIWNLAGKETGMELKTKYLKA
jgi:hypothetical protein